MSAEPPAVEEVTRPVSVKRVLLRPLLAWYEHLGLAVVLNLLAVGALLAAGSVSVLFARPWQLGTALTVAAWLLVTAPVLFAVTAASWQLVLREPPGLAEVASSIARFYLPAVKWGLLIAGAAAVGGGGLVTYSKLLKLAAADGINSAGDFALFASAGLFSVVVLFCVAAQLYVVPLMVIRA